MEKEYYICSPSVVQTMKPKEVSKAVEVYLGLNPIDFWNKIANWQMTP